MITTAAQTVLKGARTMSSASDASDELWVLLEQHRAELVLQAQAILNVREDAEDVVQETFLEISNNPQRLPKTGLGAWLKSVNRCNAVDRLRGKRSDSRRMQRRAQLEPADMFTTGGFSNLELRETLRTAIAALPEELMLIVKLRYFEHLSYKQISARLKIPVGTVNWMLMDAFAALFARLKEHTPSVNPGLRDDAETQENSPIQGADK